MSESAAAENVRLGFLATLEVDQRGITGGLLITNRLGRPLEFQCTAPIKPTRTQEILYGQTLLPYLKCDLIGLTLLERAELRPDAIFTADPDLLGLRDHLDVPVACCRTAEAGNEARTDQLRIGQQVLSIHSSHSADAGTLQQQGAHLPADADLGEPLDRIREALSETVRSGN